MEAEKGIRKELKTGTINGTKAEIKEKAVLAVSFGTSYPKNREKTIGAIEQAIAEAFPEIPVRRAFSSETIIRKLKEHNGLAVDNVQEALERAADEGIKKLAVQPTYLISGIEYGMLAETAKKYKDRFERLELAAPLLSEQYDCKDVVQAITEITASYDDGETAVCLMGHGTQAQANFLYAELQKELDKSGFSHYYIGTVEARPGLEELIEMLKAAGIYKRAVLQPLMVSAGDHANNDMAGDGEESWKGRLEKEGYEVRCILKGLGEFAPIRRIYVSRTRDALARL